MAIARPPKRNRSPPKVMHAVTANEFILAGERAEEDRIVAPYPRLALVQRTRTEEAWRIARKHVLLATASAAIPLPWVDSAAILAVQLRLLLRIAELYGVPFKERIARALLASLATGVFQQALSFGVSTGAKMIPIVGSIVGAVSLPAIVALGTYAVAQVFINHFEAGGTFLDLDPHKFRTRVLNEFKILQSTL